jgi:NAD-dependent dihydropyrimidine dehydrogenase PreA subunit
MMKRKIVHINEGKCNGCGQCIPNCAEGALKIIDGKARLVSDRYCDGLGACLGHCPMDAIEIIEREAEEFDEEAVKDYLAARLQDDAKSSKPVKSNVQCPGSRVLFNDVEQEVNKPMETSASIDVSIKPQLRQWPVQLNLVPVKAPFFEGAHLLVTADCVPFAYADYHLDLLKGRAVVVGCPKLDDIEHYMAKLSAIVKNNNIKSITVAHMEVPCCSGIVRAVNRAVENANKPIPVQRIQIGVDGTKKLI